MIARLDASTTPLHKLHAKVIDMIEYRRMQNRRPKPWKDLWEISEKYEEDFKAKIDVDVVRFKKKGALEAALMKARKETLEAFRVSAFEGFMDLR